MWECSIHLNLPGISVKGLGRLSCLVFLFPVRQHVYLASTYLDVEGVDFILSRLGDDAACVNIELRSVPRTLHRAAHEGAAQPPAPLPHNRR